MRTDIQADRQVDINIKYTDIWRYDIYTNNQIKGGHISVF